MGASLPTMRPSTNEPHAAADATSMLPQPARKFVEPQMLRFWDNVLWRMEQMVLLCLSVAVGNIVSSLVVDAVSKVNPIMEKIAIVAGIILTVAFLSAIFAMRRALYDQRVAAEVFKNALHDSVDTFGELHAHVPVAPAPVRSAAASFRDPTIARRVYNA
jgi:hypothetical protein